MFVFQMSFVQSRNLLVLAAHVTALPMQMFYADQGSWVLVLLGPRLCVAPGSL